MYRINLSEANLSSACLQEANLEKADLHVANLKGVYYLTIEQLSVVKTLYKTKLGPELMEQIKEEYPHLLEKPR